MKTDGSRKSGQTGIRLLLRVLLLITIMAAVIMEGYYIFFLRDKIDNQAEDLKNISLQLRVLKNENASLSRELSSMKKLTGDEKDGNTSDR